MDVNELTSEELRKLADERSNVKTLDIDGLVVHVDTAAVKSWKAFRVASQITEDLTPQSLQVMIEYVELISDVNEQAIVSHCGGDNASLEDVVRTIARIINEASPKKS